MNKVPKPEQPPLISNKIMTTCHNFLIYPTPKTKKSKTGKWNS